MSQKITAALKIINLRRIGGWFSRIDAEIFALLLFL